MACEDAIQVASFDLLQFDVPDVTSRPDLGDATLQALVGSGTTLTLQVRQHACCLAHAWLNDQQLMRAQVVLFTVAVVW